MEPMTSETSDPCWIQWYLWEICVKNFMRGGVRSRAGGTLKPNSWTKSSMLFTVTSTTLPWDFYFFKLTQPLTVSSVHTVLYTVKEKGETLIENHSPSLWFKKSIQNPRILKSENSRDAWKPQRNGTFINSASGCYVCVHVCVLWASLPTSADRVEY